MLGREKGMGVGMEGRRKGGVGVGKGGEGRCREGERVGVDRGEKREGNQS